MQTSMIVRKVDIKLKNDQEVVEFLDMFFEATQLRQTATGRFIIWKT